MSFSQFLDDEVMEEAVSSYKYTLNVKNIKVLFKYILGQKHPTIFPEMESTKVINVYDHHGKIKGVINDKGKSFILDTKDVNLRTMIEKNLQ